MGQIYSSYYEALDTNREAFSHGLFTEAWEWLSAALHSAFELQSARKLAKVEDIAQDQLRKVEEFFSVLSLLEPDEVGQYRALVELAATYRALVEGASHDEAHVVTSSIIDGHVFEDPTTIDEQSRMPLSSYAIDGVSTDPGTWDVKYTTAQEHENTVASAHE